MITKLFGVFSCGDVESILAALTDDFDWQGPVSEHAGCLAWGGRRRGREQVAEYFREFAATSRWHPMEDAIFTAADHGVVVEGRNCSEARSTRRSYEHQWVMVFTITDGRIARFRHYYDPADITRALD